MLGSKIVWGLWLVFISGVYIFSESYFVFFLLIVSIIVPLIFFLLIQPVKGKIHFSFEKTPIMSKNTAAVCTLSLKNTSLFPLFKGKCFFKIGNVYTGEEIEDDFFFSINTKQKESVEIECKSHYCGKLQLEIVKIEYYDFFGIFRSTKKMDLGTELLVLPDTFPVNIDLGSIGVENLESITYSEYKKGYDPSEIFDIREYEPGDSMRNIHWKLTSKFDEIFVKEPSLPIQNGVLLLLDTSIPDKDNLDSPGIADAMLEALISISQAMANTELDHAITWYDYEHKMISSYDIPNVDELSGLMSGILGIKRQRDHVSSLYWYLLLEKNIPYEHIIYITARNVDEEINHMDSKYKITVLQCVDVDGDTRESAGEFGIVFSPENTEAALSQLII